MVIKSLKRVMLLKILYHFCDEINRYGHPKESTLDRLRKRNIRVYRNDLNGAVGLDIKNNKITVDIMKEYIDKPSN